jgi:hypothetical protein
VTPFEKSVPRPASSDDVVPGWRFFVVEASAGVFQVVGTDDKGRRVVRHGTDPTELMKLAVADARAILAQS